MHTQSSAHTIYITVLRAFIMVMSNLKKDISL